MFILLRQMWRKKSVAERWCISEGLYLPKEDESKEIGQFRPISILNINGEVFFGILSWMMMAFVQKNGYIDESVQKEGAFLSALSKTRSPYSKCDLIYILYTISRVF